MSDTIEQSTQATSEPAEEVVQTTESGEQGRDVEQTENDSDDEEEQLVVKRSKYNALQRDLRIARSQAAYAERVRQQEAQRPQQQPEQRQQAISEVDPSKYNSLEEYTAAIATREREIAKAEARQEFERDHSYKQANQEAENILRSFQQRANKAAKDVPDVHEAFEYLNADHTATRFDAGVGRAILESEFAPQVLSALYNDQELLDKFLDKPARVALKELAKLEVRLESQPKAEPAPPLKSTMGLRAGSKVSRDINDPKLSDAEFKRLWKQSHR